MAIEEKCRELIRLWRMPTRATRDTDNCAEQLQDALDAHLTQPAQAVDVPDGCVLVAIERGEGYEDVHPDLVAEDCMHSATEHGWRYQVIPTSPTDKDQR